MRWTPGSRTNIEDRRGEGARFGGGGLRLGIGGFLVLLVLSIIFKRDFFALLSGSGSPSASTAEGPARVASPEEEKLVDFVSFVLDDAQKTWSQLLPGTYQDAKLVLFTDATESACGFAQSATGPFYCPLDRKVYIDLGFYGDLNRRFGASGDFAQAYVITHEIGHHVQNLMGLAGKVRRAQEERPEVANELSVRLELQADCLAGVWGHSTGQRKILEQGDVEEGLGAAAAIGDDRLQRMSRGRVSPESFTHGSSQQRVRWFQTGLREGRVAACDTFGREEI